MLRTDIINFMIEKNDYKSYLEIGVRNYYDNCDKIKCVLKHAVDPSPQNKCDFIMTSDEFFSTLNENTKYDIIFIDGLHLSYQVDKDIVNSLLHLSENGTIILHDCLPSREEHQHEKPTIGEWTGDVWKSILKIKIERPDLEIKIVDTDWGCGILKRGSQEVYQTDINPYNWIWYKDNFRNVLPILTTDEFIEEYK